ncbi:MAG: adenylosuccinate synthase [Anaerolineales bacterium]|nr:adenylosuccinate synthase [Anaerolineales bacterium]
MPLDMVIGAQWGDEGKGRMVDLFAEKASIVARFSGGDNAGHTVTVGSQIFKLHLVPSGLARAHTIGVLGNGVVINPNTLLKEIKILEDGGVSVPPERLRISPAAHLITPAHRALDAAQEKMRGKDSIGTTLRGIGPAYMDKTARHGIRAAEMLDEEAFTDRVKAHVEAANRMLTGVYHAEALDSQLVAAEYLEYARQLKPFIGDTVGLIAEALQAGETVLAEGAQGTLLDLDHGTYPFVTSSNPTAPGALTGLGVGPVWVNQVIGVAKAFQTRVGEGGFPTELEGEMAVRLRGTGENPWDEYGTTTGRPRRVGWLDLVLLRYAMRVNGFTHLALTKMDILSGLDSIKLCVGYQREGVSYQDLPLGVYQMELYQPVYEELPGWVEDIQSARVWQDLPVACQNYVRRIEEVVGVRVGWISVGPEREQMVRLVDLE